MARGPALDGDSRCAVAAVPRGADLRRDRGALGRALLSVLLLAIAAAAPAAEEPAQEPKAAPQLDIRVEGLKGAQADAVRDSLDLSLFVKRSDLTASRLRRMVAAAPKQARRALEVYGYYEAKAKAESVERAGGWTVTITVEPGRRTVIAAVDATVEGPAAGESEVTFALESVRRLKDDPFEHVRYEDAKRRVERALLRLGYFDFELGAHRVDVRRADATARVALAWTSGERYSFGPLRFEGAQFPDTFLARYVTFQPGDPFDQDRLEELQRHLAGSDYFDQIAVEATHEGATDRAVPVVVALTPGKRTVYRIGVSADTDYGFGVRVAADRRYLNARGHRLNSDLRVAQQLVALTAEYLIPRLADPDSVWGVGLVYRDEHTEVVDSRSWVAIGSRAERWHEWHVVGSANYLDSKYLVDQTGGDASDEESVDSAVAYPELRADRVFARDRIRPRHGAALSMRARAASESLGSDISMLQLYASAKWVLSLGKNARLLVRGELGATGTGDVDALPPELRFFAGGIDSVRGYGYQTVGDEDSSGDATGGKHLVTASVEYERLFHPQFAWAAFADAGDAWSDRSPDPVLGVGMGLRWLSPVGPVRLDFAHGLDNDDHRVELHISAGPDL